MRHRAVGRQLGIVALAWFSVAWPGASRAEGNSLTDALGVRAISQGEAVRASATGATATQLNPAGAALSKSYSLEATYGFRGEDSATVAGAAVCDSVTNRVAACIYYSYFDSQPEGGSRSLHDVGLTLALPLGDKVFIGNTTRYVDYTESGSLAMPEDNSRDGALVTDLGLVLRLADQLALAGVGYNLLGHDDDNFPRAIGSGVSLILGEKLTLGADGVWNLDAPEGEGTGRYGVGGELFLAGEGAEQGYPIRVGYVYDRSKNQQYVTAGLGFITPRIGVDVGLRRQVAGDEGDELLIQFGLRLFMPQ